MVGRGELRRLVDQAGGDGWRAALALARLYLLKRSGSEETAAAWSRANSARGTPQGRRSRRLAQRALHGGPRGRHAVRQLACAAPGWVMVPRLAEVAAMARDPKVAALAIARLRRLDDSADIDPVCQVWADTRAANLAELLHEKGWRASGAYSPLPVLTALHADRADLLGTRYDALKLIEATADPESRIRERAAAALAGLTDPEARQAVYAAAIDDGNADALRAALSGEFAVEPTQRAILLFLAGEFERYAELDFDGGLLRAAHTAAHRGLRARLAASARASGRLDWVRTVTGADSPARLRDLSLEEWAAVTDMLIGGRQGERMWELASLAPPRYAAELLRALADGDWRPDPIDHRAGFDELTRLARSCPRSVPPVPPTLRRQVAQPAARSVQPVNVMSISRDGRLLATGGIDGVVRLWALPSGEPAGELEGSLDEVWSLEISADGRQLAAGGDGGLQLWDLPSGRLRRSLRGHTGVVGSLAMSPDGRVLASGGGSEGPCAPRLWSLPSGDPGPPLPTHQRIWDLCISPDGGLLATSTGCFDEPVRLFRLPTGDAAGALEARGGTAGSLIFTGDGQLLVENIGASESGFTRWAMPGGKLLSDLVATPGPQHAKLALAPDDSLVAAVTLSGIQLWRLPSGDAVQPELTGHSGVTAMTISHDGSVLVTGGGDGTVRLWRLPSGHRGGIVARVETPGLYHWISEVSVIADDRLLAVATSDGVLRLWNLPDVRFAGLLHRPTFETDQPEVDALRAVCPAPEQRAWFDLVEAVVRWRGRYDVEVDEVAAEAGWDIELGAAEAAETDHRADGR